MYRSISGSVARILACTAFLALTHAGLQAAETYTAKLQPLNAGKIGSSASGSATLKIDGDALDIVIDAQGLPADMMHLQHFHGFADGKQATCPTATADTNSDGYIDLLETEPMAGTTMLPFHQHPATMEIPNDTYPTADAKGSAHYSHTDSVAAVEKGLKEKLKTPELALAKRVIFIHGVPGDSALPLSVKSLPGVPAQVTLPIACGEIEVVQ